MTNKIQLSMKELEDELALLDLTKTFSPTTPRKHMAEEEESDSDEDEFYFETLDDPASDLSDESSSISGSSSGSSKSYSSKSLENQKWPLDRYAASSVIVVQKCVRRYIATKRLCELVRLDNERMRLLKEIIDAESVFVLSLHYLCSHFLVVLKHENSYKVDDLLENLLNTIYQLKDLHPAWLKQLQERYLSWQSKKQIGSVLEELVMLLTHYNFYCSNYLHVMHWVQSQMKSQSFTKAEKKCCDELQRSTGISTNLQVLLSLPLTNLRSYHMIFEKMQQCTPHDHVDYKSIAKLIDKLNDVAFIAASSVKVIENKQKIASIQQLLTGNAPKLAAPNRQFIFEGSLTKLCRKVTKRRYFWLFSDSLLYGIPTTMNNNKTYKFHRILTMVNSRFVDLAEDPSRSPYAFQIVTPSKSFMVFADNQEQKNNWLQAHARAISVIEQRGAAVKLKTDTQSLAPVWLHDNMSNCCMLCHKAFTVVIRRHHCRKCGRLVCNTCSGKKIVLKNIGHATRVCDPCYKSSPAADMKKI